MAMHLQREIEKLKKRIILLAGTVERRLADAVRALSAPDAALAKSIRDQDIEIDLAEVDVEEECLKILALHQPVANDLRFIVAVLKINNDLERIGDEAVNIAGRVLHLIGQPAVEPPFELAPVTSQVQAMLKQSLDALVNLDAAQAHAVRQADDSVDDLVREQFERVKAEIRLHPERVDSLIEYMRIFRYLERIADHATNIAEDVIYLTEGQIVRHQEER
ncbi:MAG TPA: phosphate signaling complex protein PhoU [Candidatus Aminicenantes bacterium]|nr:phosphate signaling complex protein PhoU [Candidatus Aminicenantes bacterium]